MFLYSVGRKPGRPKVIPEATVPKVIALYKQGLGYRAIARELKKENLSVNWSTVRRLIKKNCGVSPYIDVPVASMWYLHIRLTKISIESLYAQRALNRIHILVD